MQITYYGVPETTNKNVEVILVDSLSDGDSTINDYTVENATLAFNAEGPYAMAKRLGLLANNSAEDMAIDFMSYVNSIFPNTY